MLDSFLFMTSFQSKDLRTSLELKMECDERLTFSLPSFSPCSPVIPQVFRNGLEAPHGADSPSSAVDPPQQWTHDSDFSPSRRGPWVGSGEGRLHSGSCVCSILGMSWRAFGGSVVSLFLILNLFLWEIIDFINLFLNVQMFPAFIFAPFKLLTVGSMDIYPSFT